MGSKETRILVVDDDKEFSDGLAEHLKELGFDVSVAYDGREGLDEFHKSDFRLVLTDLEMPGMDGMELLHGIKKQDSRSVVVVITGHGTIERAVQAIRDGAYDFITKPVKFDELDIVVARALEKYTLVHQLGFFRGLTLAVLVSIPIWLILGIILASKVF
jgi:DNA-binding NtrC family response regulator